MVSIRNAPDHRILAIASAGRGSQDERRIQLLLEGLDHTVVSLDRDRGRVGNAMRMLGVMWRRRRDLVLLEGTGVVSGVPAIVVSLLTGGRFRYLISSGDAVAPFVRMKAGRLLGAFASVYERLLYRRSFAFIGWTPHFVGRALHLGAARGVTIPGFPVVDPGRPDPGARAALRERWGVPKDGFVVGVVGSINLPNKDGYGYGTELVGVARLLPGDLFRFLVIGDGPGLDRLRVAAAGDHRFVFTGRISAEEVPGHMRALDASVILQTHDLVGGLRWTTKLPELLACNVPCILSGTPAFLDLVTSSDDRLLHMLPEAAPGSAGQGRAIADRLTLIRALASTSDQHDGFGPAVQTPMSLEVARARFRSSLVAWGIQVRRPG
jgi:glycosyltransferase involved in cell wall biosynthesis